jgi:hypothetical protein
MGVCLHGTGKTVQEAKRKGEKEMTGDYYVLQPEDPLIGHRAQLVYKPDRAFRSWMSGAAFEDTPPEPIRLELEGTDEEGWIFPDLWEVPIPVMSQRLHSALLNAGVSNLDTYAVELHDPVNEKIYTDYVAFNLVGKIAAADMDMTVFAPESPDRMISADIDSLAIDEKKARGALMFRLAESVNVVLVHDSVCDAIEDAGIETLKFYEPEDIAT